MNFPSLAASRLFRSIVSEVPPVTSTVITSGTATGFPHARAASPMSPNEEMTQASRPKRPAAATAVSSAAAAEQHPLSADEAEPSERSDATRFGAGYDAARASAASAAAASTRTPCIRPSSRRSPPGPSG